MRIAMSVCVYYSLDHLFSRYGGVCWEKCELQCLCVCIIPLITYFPNMEGVAHRNGDCNVCMCILFPWSRISPNMEGVAHRNENCNVCMCILFPWSPISPWNMEGVAQRNENCTVCTCILFPWCTSPNMEGVAHRNENCNVCTCILFPWSPISLTWMCSSQKWELQCMYVYIIPINTNFPKHEVGCSHKWDLQCLYVYIIPLIISPPDMEGFAERNENCNVCVCILFLWSPISPTWRGLLTEMRIAMSVCVYYSLGHVFPQTWRGLLTEMRIAMSVYVYYSLYHLFPQHGGGCSQKWEFARYVCVYYSLDHLFHQTWRGLPYRKENCNVCMCILFHGGGFSEKWELHCLYIPITYFPNMEGVAHINENCNVCMCILFPCFFPWEFTYVYIFPWSRISPNMEGVAHRNENCNVCMCILFPWSPISLTRMCSSQTWELQCMYVYIIPINTNFPKHGVGCSHKWDLYVYIIPWSPISPNMVYDSGGCWEKYSPTWRELQCLYVYIIPLITYFPKHGGGCSQKWEFPWFLQGGFSEKCTVCVYIIPLITYFTKHGGGCSQKWELQCLYVYIIPLITYFPNKDV